jgi:hypothetical protein
MKDERHAFLERVGQTCNVRAEEVEAQRRRNSHAAKP